MNKIGVAGVILVQLFFLWLMKQRMTRYLNDCVREERRLAYRGYGTSYINSNNRSYYPDDDIDEDYDYERNEADDYDDEADDDGMDM